MNSSAPVSLTKNQKLFTTVWKMIHAIIIWVNQQGFAHHATFTPKFWIVSELTVAIVFSFQSNHWRGLTNYPIGLISIRNHQFVAITSKIALCQDI